MTQGSSYGGHMDAYGQPMGDGGYGGQQSAYDDRSGQQAYGGGELETQLFDGSFCNYFFYCSSRDVDSSGYNQNSYGGKDNGYNQMQGYY